MPVKIRRDPGTVELVDYMGDDKRVADAARVSVAGQEPKSTNEKLLKYLWNNGHTSPFEHATLTFRITCPIFTARQIMRHRTFSYNEMSARYTEMDLGYYLPKKLYAQSQTNKQGTNPEPLVDSIHLLNMEFMIKQADDSYRKALSDGVSREQARMILPMSTMTSFYMTGNLLNWLKFLKLRWEDHAQYEVWYIADQIAEVIPEGFPLTWEAVKEDVHGTERQMAESRHTNRTVFEGGERRQSSKDSTDSPSHSTEILESIWSTNKNWSTKRET